MSRCFPFVLSALALLAVRARAAEPPTGARLTEAQAVKRALENPALLELRAGWIGEATAEGIDHSTWQNPSLSYTREQLLGSEPQGEDYLSLSQSFDVSGRRKLWRRAAHAREEAAERRVDAVEVDIAAIVRRRFHRLLFAQARTRLLQDWRAQVTGHLDVVIAREKAGDAAPYDRLRLQRELASIDALVDREDAAAIKAWALLDAVLEPEANATEDRGVPALDGELLPPIAPGVARSIAATRTMPEVEARDAEARALAFERRAASRWWVPSPTVAAGYKGVDVPMTGGRTHGFVVSLGIPLPLLDRGRAERTRVASRARAVQAESRLQAIEARAQASALAREVARLADAARAMDRRNAEVSAPLVKAAESGYRGGEIGVMELVDAYRSSAEAELLELDLAMQAREAEIELRRRTEGRS